MSNDRMILVLCLIISIIALIVGSVALSRDDRQHTIIEYDDSSTNSTSEKSLVKYETKYWERVVEKKMKSATYVIPKPSKDMVIQKYISINNGYQIHNFHASHHSPSFYLIVDGMPSRFHNSSNTYVISAIQIINFYYGTIKGTQTMKGAQKDIDIYGLIKGTQTRNAVRKDIDINGHHYYDWTLSVDARKTSVEINKVDGKLVCKWDLKQK